MYHPKMVATYFRITFLIFFVSSTLNAQQLSGNFGAILVLPDECLKLLTVGVSDSSHNPDTSLNMDNEEASFQAEAQKKVKSTTRQIGVSDSDHNADTSLNMDNEEVSFQAEAQKKVKSTTRQIGVSDSEHNADTSLNMDFKQRSYQIETHENAQSLAKDNRMLINDLSLIREPYGKVLNLCKELLGHQPTGSRSSQGQW